MNAAQWEEYRKEIDFIASKKIVFITAISESKHSAFLVSLICEFPHTNYHIDNLRGMIYSELTKCAGNAIETEITGLQIESFDNISDAYNFCVGGNRFKRDGDFFNKIVGVPYTVLYEGGITLRGVQLYTVSDDMNTYSDKLLGF